MNIFQNRLKEISDKNKDNQFKHEISLIIRDKSRIIQKSNFKFNGFLFNGNIHSNKIEDELFTNFVSSYDNLYFKNLETILDKLHYDNYEFLDEFELEENNYSEISEASKRLKRIIQQVNNIDVSPSINEMIPVKYLKQEDKRYERLRLFVHVSEDGYIELYLIDLYHLGIDAYNQDTQKRELKRNYNSNENCSKCISKIADQYC